MANVENASKRRKNRCKSAHAGHDITSEGNKLLTKRRPKSMGQNLYLLERKYLELRELIIGSIAARSPVERLLLGFFMQEDKRFGQIMNIRPPQNLSFNHNIQARRIYKKAFDDALNKERLLEREKVSRGLPSVFRLRSDQCDCQCCNVQNSKRTKRKCQDCFLDTISREIKTRKEKSRPILKRGASSSKSFANIHDLSDNDHEHASAGSSSSLHKLKKTKNSDPLFGGASSGYGSTTDDVYNWHNCSREVRDWLREKNRMMSVKRREERKQAREKEEQDEMERKKRESQKMEAREKARVWLEQRKKKTTKQQSPSVGSRIRAVSPVRKARFTEAQKIEEFRAGSQELPEDKAMGGLLVSCSLIGEAENEEQQIRPTSRYENKDGEVDVAGDEKHQIDSVTQVLDFKNLNEDEPEKTDFQKLMDDFCNSEDLSNKSIGWNNQPNFSDPTKRDIHSDKNTSLNKNSLSDNDATSEALLRREADLNFDHKVNEWLYDSGKVIENSKPTKTVRDENREESKGSSNPVLGKTSPRIDSKIVDKKKSIKMNQFDLLRSQTIDDDNKKQNSGKIDLEQFNRLIIHDEQDSTENSHQEYATDLLLEGQSQAKNNKRQTFIQTDHTTENAGLATSSGAKGLLRLTNDFGKFDESYSSGRMVEFPLGMLNETETRRSHEGRPTTTRRIEREEQCKIFA